MSFNQKKQIHNKHESFYLIIFCKIIVIAIFSGLTKLEKLANHDIDV